MRLSAADSIVVLTGAGISRESGLHTFRDAGGIWSRVRLEDVATPEAFRRSPDRVRTFYNARRRALLAGGVEPNLAHLALARLESRHPGPVLVVTQNIDDLHERAGTRNLIHMHGDLLKSRCVETGRVHSQREDIAPGSACSCCGAAGTLRPHVVWFGEVPFQLDEIFRALRSCDIFIAVGTSGQVWPAAGFVDEVRARTKAWTVELNMEPTGLSSLFNESLLGPASEVVPAFVERLLA